METVVIVSAARTPIGSFQGALAGFSAPQLGAIAIKAAIEKAGIAADQVQEVVMGNVLSAGIGQAPARQAAVFAGLPVNTVCTTVNKVCASGMKAIMMAAQSIMTGEIDIAVAGGMESMSNVPYYLPSYRNGGRLGHGSVEDGIIKDGLWDVYKNFHMGNAAEICAREYGITREEQDAYAINSYKRAQQASADGIFDAEIAPVEIKDKKGNVTYIRRDEEIDKVNFEKIPTLRPVFEKDGTVTAANASSLNDGAAAVVLMSKSKANALGIKPLAIVRSMASAEKAPEWFTTAPADALPLAVKRAGISLSDVDLWEINEAFSVVCIANNRLLNLDESKTNVYGGAVSMGHPIGCSGARIVVTLLNALSQKSKKIGAAGICNGGGGASAIVIERV
jgi:acetyl-CoA C-acetyltransferase